MRLHAYRFFGLFSVPQHRLKDFRRHCPARSVEREFIQSSEVLQHFRNMLYYSASPAICPEMKRHVYEIEFACKRQRTSKDSYGTSGVVHEGISLQVRIIGSCMSHLCYLMEYFYRSLLMSNWTLCGSALWQNRCGQASCNKKKSRRCCPIR